MVLYYGIVTNTHGLSNVRRHIFRFSYVCEATVLTNHIGAVKQL